MEDQILKELKQIKDLLSRIIGTQELPKSKKFSKEALDKAALEFKKLSVERSEWITGYEITKIIKNAPYNYVGTFIVEKFGFSSYFKLGRTMYYNKKDIEALNNELKEKNINLRRYEELLKDQE